jgi:hypothetical protein
MIFGLINFAILTAISAIHVYWAFGGKWGSAAALPELGGQKVLNPDIFSTLIVATGLGAMAVLHLHKISLFALPLPNWLDSKGLWVITAIFFIRAIGDFRYVGFFKKVKNSLFASLDTKYYSPLCLIISLNALLTSINDF